MSTHHALPARASALVVWSSSHDACTSKYVDCLSCGRSLCRRLGHPARVDSDLELTSPITITQQQQPNEQHRTCRAHVTFLCMCCRCLRCPFQGGIRRFACQWYTKRKCFRVSTPVFLGAANAGLPMVSSFDALVCVHRCPKVTKFSPDRLHQHQLEFGSTSASDHYGIYYRYLSASAFRSTHEPCNTNSLHRSHWPLPVLYNPSRITLSDLLKKRPDKV